MKKRSHSVLPIFTLCALLPVLGFAEKSSAVTILTFDDPIQLDPTYPSPPPADAPVWRADRYPAAIFESAILGSENVLEFGVSQADSFAARDGGSFSSSFYNFQGFKLTIPMPNPFISADLFIPSSRPSDLGAVNAGLWGSASLGGTITVYPIIAYRDDLAIDAGFYYWNPIVGWEVLELGSFEDSFYTLRIELDQPNDQFLLSVTSALGGLVGSATSAAYGSETIGELFLNMANTFSNAPVDPDNPQTYSVFVDNVSYTPEPSRALLISLALIPVMLRRRRATAA